MTSGSEVFGDGAGGVLDRLAAAEQLLSGLALLGSSDRVVLDRAGRGAGSAVADLVAAIDVVSGQAKLASEAGRTAGERASWLAVTAPHWHEYLRWLHDELATLQPQADRVGGSARQNVDAAMLGARTQCQAAHLQWAGITEPH